MEKLIFFMNLSKSSLIVISPESESEKSSIFLHKSLINNDRSIFSKSGEA